MAEKFEPLRGKVKMYEPEAEVLKLFLELWKEKSGKDYVDRFPFANQDNWTGTSVMDFAKFIVQKKNEDLKSAVQGLVKEIEKESEELTKALEYQVDNAGDEKEEMYLEGKIAGIMEMEDIVLEKIKKWLADACENEIEGDGNGGKFSR